MSSSSTRALPLHSQSEFVENRGKRPHLEVQEHDVVFEDTQETKIWMQQLRLSLITDLLYFEASERSPA